MDREAVAVATRILSAREMKSEGQTAMAWAEPEYGMEYLNRLPKVVPPGKALVHNRVVRPTRRLGANGFHAFLVDENDHRWRHRKVCNCGWAPELGTHYRVE